MARGNPEARAAVSGTDARSAPQGLEAEGLEASVLAHAETSLQAAAGKRWVIHVTRPDDRGPRTFLRYLARYVYRVAMDDRRVLRWEEDQITFRTRGAKTKTLSGSEFARRFLQHALPKGFPGSVGAA